MLNKRHKPRFHRQYSQTRIAVKNKPRWRKPRGIYSAQALGLKSRGHIPTIGYRQPKSVRGKHPSGYNEILLKNIKQLEGIDPKKYAIRLSATLGMKKRIEVVKKADEKKIIILNRPLKKTVKKAKKKLETKTASKPAEKKTSKENEKGVKEIANEVTPTPEEKKAAEEVKKEIKKTPSKK